MKNIFSKLFLSVLMLLISAHSYAQLKKNQLEDIRNGYELRREMAFELLRGKPLVKGKIIPPIFSDGSNFSRHYSYSLMDYAFKCFWLNEDIDKANQALKENADYYIGYPAAYKDKDSFYWAVDEMCRMLEMYGRNGNVSPALITRETEDRIYLMMWQFSKMQSKIEKTEFKKSNTWTVEESENHHVQRFYAYWHFAKFLKEDPQYANLKYDDGYTAAQHYQKWSDYIKCWLSERGRKGLFVEMANDAYGLESLKGIYNFYDYGSDAGMKKLANNLIDLYWAAWAQEQLGGVRAGAKCRVYPYEAHNGRTVFWKMAWYYLGIGEMNAPYNNLYTLIASSYRMPVIIMDLALNTYERGNYEIVQRRLGLAKDGLYTPPVYKMDQKGGLVRYSYCTPEFIASSFFCEARNYEDWTMISSQNRWSGIVFSGNTNARVYPLCKAASASRVYNAYWGVQSKGCIIYQKLQDSIQSRGALNMQIWISNAGMRNIIEKDGIVYAEAPEAYVAIKYALGSYKMSQGKEGRYMESDNALSPVIIEVAPKKDFADYDSFQLAVSKKEIVVENELLSYQSLNGDILTLPLNYKGVGAVNGKPLDLYPKKGMSSPFLNTDFNTGMINIKKGNDKLDLKF